MSRSSSLLFPSSFLSSTGIPDHSRPECAGQAQYRQSELGFGYIAEPAHSTGYEPNRFDKVTTVDSDATSIHDPNYDSISDFSDVTRNVGLFSIPTLRGRTSVSHVSGGGNTLPEENQPRETVYRQKQQTESFSSDSKKNLFRRKDLREHLEQRAQQAILGEGSGQRNLYYMSITGSFFFLPTCSKKT